MVGVVVVAVAVVVEVRVVKLVKLVKLVKWVKLISVYFFDIFTSKKAQNPQFFTLSTSKCASRHNGVHFFDTFSTPEPPKVARTCSVLYILTSKCASRHNGVHFFMSHLASWLRTRRFSEPTFRPSGATNHWKNTVFRDFPIFSRICIFFLLILSLLTRLTSAFQLSILSEVSLLNFLRLKITKVDDAGRHWWHSNWHFSFFYYVFPQQQNALGSSAIVKVSEQTGAAPKFIPPRFPGSKYRFPVQVPK